VGRAGGQHSRRRHAPDQPRRAALLGRRSLAFYALWFAQGSRPTSRSARLGAQHRHLSGRALGEYKIRGAAVAEGDPSVQRAYATEVHSRLGWTPTAGKFHLFRIDVADIAFIRYEAAAGDQFVTRWPPGTEYLRRGDTATSLGAAEEYSALLK
jgi:hypothetical protein